MGTTQGTGEKGWVFYHLGQDLNFFYQIMKVFPTIMLMGMVALLLSQQSWGATVRNGYPHVNWKPWNKLAGSDNNIDTNADPAEGNLKMGLAAKREAANEGFEAAAEKE